jgi:uncharacterized protein YbdZ (MbtH family)
MDKAGDTLRLRVVIEHEELYSILPATSKLPIKWKVAGNSATRMSAWHTSKITGRMTPFEPEKKDGWE